MLVVDLMTIITAKSAFMVTIVALSHGLGDGNVGVVGRLAMNSLAPDLLISLATGAVVSLLIGGKSVVLVQLVGCSATVSRVRVRSGLGLISGYFESNCIKMTQLHKLFFGIHPLSYEFLLHSWRYQLNWYLKVIENVRPFF